MAYGPYYRCWIDVIIIISIVCGIIGTPLAIIVAIREYSFGILMVVLMFLLCVPCFIYGEYFLRKQRRLMNLALKDSIKLTASAIITRDDRHTNLYDYVTDIRLSVKFFYNGQKRIITSAKPSKKTPFIKKNMPYKYDGKIINILYSEKYDHVFILKD